MKFILKSHTKEDVSKIPIWSGFATSGDMEIPGRSWGKSYDNFHPSSAPLGDRQPRPGISTYPQRKLNNAECRCVIWSMPDVFISSFCVLFATNSTTFHPSSAPPGDFHLSPRGAKSLHILYIWVRPSTIVAKSHAAFFEKM